MSSSIVGAKRLIDQLVKKNVKDIFGYPGGAILPVLNELHEHKKINYYLSRTEQGAGFMADGYAKITGKMGVVMTTSGPSGSCVRSARGHTHSYAWHPTQRAVRLKLAFATAASRISGSACNSGTS